MKIVSALAGFLLSWLIARLYGAEGVGLYAVGVTTAVLLAYLSLAGQDYIILRSVSAELKVERADIAGGILRTCTRNAVTISFFVGLILILLSGELAARIGNLAARPMLLAVAPAVVALALMRTGSWGLRGAGSIIASQAIEGPITTGAAIICICLLWAAGWLPPAWGLGVIYTSSIFTAAAVAWLLFFQVSRDWPSGCSIGSRGMLVAGVPMLLSTVSSVATEWVATLSTSVVAGPAAAGHIRIGLQIMGAITLVTAAFDGVIGPRIAAAWKTNDHATIRRVYQRSTIGMLALASPLLAAAIITPGWLMGLFGPSFREGAIVLQILALGQMFAVAGGPIGTILVMSRHDRWLSAYSLASLGVIAILCLVAVPVFGAAGGAMVVTGTMIFRRVSAGVIVRYKTGVRLSLWRS